MECGRETHIENEKDRSKGRKGKKIVNGDRVKERRERQHVREKKRKWNEGKEDGRKEREHDRVRREDHKGKQK